MQHGTGSEPKNSLQPTDFDSDIIVFAGDYSHRVPARMSSVQDGIGVIAAGTVKDIAKHGDTDTSATFHLSNDFGQSVYAYVSSDVLATFQAYLVNGAEVSLHGVAMRPYPGTPPYIHVVQVEPLT